ncbi:Multidrug resistance protein Stp [Pseudomonas fluorescens]|uniref:Multidrug resistance protein Stp n=1 Tax=Pseudomonas fluorescens TaxID=294 RepID=A0A5E6XY49_PSEFL|nr:MFS transporter [Pseudomonas fluorescens]VVN45359.1 Multidrug resistance protein Stp [Pseudomonas fluorescens]
MKTPDSPQVSKTMSSSYLCTERNSALMVGIISFAAFSGAMMQSLVVPLLAAFPDLLHTDASTVSWLITGLLLSGAVSNVVFGRLGDIYGKRQMILLCLSFLVVGSLIGAVTNDIGWLIFARTLQGSAIAVVPLGISCLAEFLTGRTLVRGISLVSAMVGVGASLGFVLSAVVAQYFDWHFLFALSALLGTVALIGVLRVFPYRPGLSGQSFDIVGALGLAIGLCCLLLGISKGYQWGWSSFKTWSFLIAGVLVLAAWFKNQLSKNNPLVDLRIAMRPAILLTNLATILIGFSMYGIVLTQPMVIQLPTALGYGLGLSILAAGLSFIPGGLISLLLPTAASNLSARFGARTTVIFGGLSMALGYLLLIFWHASLFELIFGSIFVAIGTTLCYGTVPMVILANTPGNETGQATGINNLARSIGTSSSIAFSVAVMATVNTTLSSQVYPSEQSITIIYAISVLASLMICVAMLFVSTGIRKK